jgi:hypothetical protein
MLIDAFVLEAAELSSDNKNTTVIIPEAHRLFQSRNWIPTTEHQ